MEYVADILQIVVFVITIGVVTWIRCKQLCALYDEAMGEIKNRKNNE